MSEMYAILFNKSQKKCLGDSPVGRTFDDHVQISEFNPPAQMKLSWCCILAASGLVGQRQGDQQCNTFLGFTVSSRVAWAICKTMSEKQSIQKKYIF